MIKGRVPTLYVSDMDRAVHFCSQPLELRMKSRYGDHWVEVDAGNVPVLGLHPRAADVETVSASRSISIGFSVDEPLDGIVRKLEERGVAFGGPIRSDEKAGIRLIGFHDPDGDDLHFCEYVGTHPWATGDPASGGAFSSEYKTGRTCVPPARINLRPLPSVTTRVSSSSPQPSAEDPASYSRPGARGPCRR